MEKKIGKKGNRKAVLYLAQLLENKQFLEDRDNVAALSGINQIQAIKKLIEDYFLTDLMLQEVFRTFPTLGSNLTSNDLCKISDNPSGSLGFPLKIEVSSLASKGDVVDFVIGNWSKIKKILQKGKDIPRIKGRKSEIDYEIDFWIYWMKKQGATIPMIRRVIKDKCKKSISSEEVSARYIHEINRRNKQIKGSR